MNLKEVVRQIIPHGAQEYSVRRHDYMRLGIEARAASRLAFSIRDHELLLDAKLNYVPKSILSALRTCVDAGANAGTWTSALLRLFHPERVIAVECDPRLIEALQNKFGQISTFTLVNAALAGSDGSAMFNQLRNSCGSSLLTPRAEIRREFLDNSWDVIATPKVRTISYDNLVAAEPEISILKLDIQAGEMDMLTASHSGLQKTKCIIMEVTFTSHYEGDAGFPELHNLLASKGFGLYRLSAPYDRGARVLFSDAVYVQEEILNEMVPDR